MTTSLSPRSSFEAYCNTDYLLFTVSMPTSLSAFTSFEANSNAHAFRFTATMTTSLSARIGDDGAKALADALKQKNSLTWLELNYTDICAEGAKALGDALKQNATLRVLNLQSCKIGDEGAKALSDVLKENSSLAFLGLVDTGICDEGAKVLCGALTKNSTLKYLSLDQSSWRNKNLIGVISSFSSFEQEWGEYLSSPIPVSLPFWKKLAYGPRDILYSPFRERAGLLTESSNKRLKLSNRTSLPLPTSGGIR